MPHDNLLIVADSERNADMLYAVGTLVPEPFIWFTRKGQSYVVLNDLEFDRVHGESRRCRVLSHSRYERRLEREKRGEMVRFSDVLGTVLREHRIKKVTVAESFPLGLAKALRALRIKVKLRAGSFFPDRAWKSADEVKKISAALVMAEVGLAEGLHALRRAKPGRGRRLMHNHAPLTSERLRGIIDSSVLQAGGNSGRTIVAGGRQSSDPHERGHGPLYANEPIVIHIFPRSQRTGYFGDVTRTVVRGHASDFVRGMFAAVQDARQTALRLARHGAAASEVHLAAENVFRRCQFKTSRRNGHMEGFFHGTGHGIGLEIHEPPRLSPLSRETLRAGHVVALEPGLYYPAAGGVRLNEVVLIKRGLPQTLSNAATELEV